MARYRFKTTYNDDKTGTIFHMEMPRIDITELTDVSGPMARRLIARNILMAASAMAASAGVLVEEDLYEALDRIESYIDQELILQAVRSERHTVASLLGTPPEGLEPEYLADTLQAMLDGGLLKLDGYLKVVKDELN